MAQGNPSWGECKNGGVFLWLPPPPPSPVIVAIRSRVPRHRRRWNELTKIWWVHDNCIDAVEEILRTHYPNYDPYAGM